jgi:DNA mismatch repair protein MSH5
MPPHVDGAALFCGVIKHLLNRGSSCPKVLVATHFHQVNSEILSSPELSISFVHMQVMFTTSLGTVLPPNTSSAEDEDEEAVAAGLRPGDKITYLYRYVWFINRLRLTDVLTRVAKGLARHSHAAKCAELCGLPRPIVERAQIVT